MDSGKHRRGCSGYACYAEFGFFSFLDCITEHEIGAFLMTFRMIALKLARNEYLEYS